MPCYSRILSINWNSLIPIGAAFIAIIGSVILWILNERSKRRQETKERKEVRYVKLILTINGFYSDKGDKGMKDEFLKQVELCWMYCPDSVIYKAYQFLKMMETGDHTKEEEKKVMGEFILEIRKDLIQNKELRNTQLKPEDFILYKSKE